MAAEMKTLQEEWREYRDKIYPEGISGVQNRECHQAFFAGALVVSKQLNDISKLPEGVAEAQFQKMVQEAFEVTSSIAQSIRARN